MRGFRVLCLALFAVASCSAAYAATVEDVSGSVSLSRGSGYNKIASSTAANPGDSVMAGQNGQAWIVYSDGCREKVAPGSVVIVKSASPCTVGALDDTTLMVLGGAAVIGGVTAVIVLSNDDDKASSP